MKNIDRAFVLGGSGYIGKYLVAALLEQQIAVTALINHTPLNISSDRLTQVYGSLADYTWSESAANADVIFHTARMSGKSKKSRRRAAQLNRRANDRLAEWLASLDSPPLLVYVSGTLVYGSQGTTPVDENATPNPISFQREYFMAEKPILQALTRGRLPVIIARPSWVYGPGSWLRAFYLHPVIKKNIVPLYGNGNNLMSFIHVKDVAGKLIHLSRYGAAGNIYNLYSHPAIPQHAFTGILSRLTSAPVKKKPFWWIRLRHDSALAEAFTFSLNVKTLHPEIEKNYTLRYPDFEQGLEEVVKGEL